LVIRFAIVPFPDPGGPMINPCGASLTDASPRTATDARLVVTTLATTPRCDARVIEGGEVTMGWQPPTRTGELPAQEQSRTEYIKVCSQNPNRTPSGISREEQRSGSPYPKRIHTGSPCHFGSNGRTWIQFRIS
jgi:hypothetical protein